MGRSCLLEMLLISMVFSISITQGHCRWIKLTVNYDKGYPSHEENSSVERGMMEMVMDYGDPRANTNHRGGAFNPPTGSSHKP
ncbi:uncharacterized protein LOC120262369 [Dioscorea cayenensis subsp. rotundata]|uniref:Uncharacterized protein LOC120262369 n=1 Tax=Dioscorea cayennensis subsp. rotundata TaxID=55577 RepID=A0AB40BGB7_DIOCR|nr:uncharacterized protein LOC120262369 [Dioscorea cayenensis subsp. rotundata]